MTQPLIRIAQIDSDELSLTIRTEIQTGVVLDDVSNVSVPSPTENQVLSFAGSPIGWIAVANVAAGLGAVGSPITKGDFLVYQGSPSVWVNTSTISLTDDRIILSGVSVPGSPATTNITSLEISSTLPGIMLEDTDGASNEKVWRFIVTGGDLVGEMRSDSGTSSNRWLEVIRNGIQDSEFSLFVGAEETAIRAIDGGAVQLYHDNVDVAETTTAIAGGFRVNNLLTGAGFERVLTTSDIGGGSPDTPVSLGELSDVTLAGGAGSPSVLTGDLLYHNGSVWTNTGSALTWDGAILSVHEGNSLQVQRPTDDQQAAMSWPTGIDVRFDMTDTGDSDQAFVFARAGTELLRMSTADGIAGGNAQAPAMNHTSASQTDVAFKGNKNDPNSGMNAGGDAVQLIAGGQIGVEFREIASEVLQLNDIDQAEAASVTQTQGQGQITSSYAEIRTVANPNDVVTLPSGDVGKRCIVWNMSDVGGTPNTLQIYPPSAQAIDNLAQNVSVTLEPGRCAFFMVLNNTSFVKWQSMHFDTTLGSLSDVTLAGGAGSPSLPETGDTLFYDGSNWINLARGTAGQVLTMGSPLVPSWSDNITETIVIGSPIVQTVIASHATAIYRSAEFLIQAVRGDNFHLTKILAIHDDTNTEYTEFGTVTIPSFFGSPSTGSPAISGAQATYVVDVSGGNLRLLATPREGTGNITFKVTSTLTTV